MMCSPRTRGLSALIVRDRRVRGMLPAPAGVVRSAPSSRRLERRVLRARGDGSFRVRIPLCDEMRALHTRVVQNQGVILGLSLCTLRIHQMLGVNGLRGYGRPHAYPFPAGVLGVGV